MSVKVHEKQEQKILRILRLRVTDKPGYLGRLASLLGELGANIGDIIIASQGPDYLIREINVQVDDMAHLEKVVQAISAIEGVQLVSVIDPVQHAHEGGKIATRSKAPLESIAQVRKIYTPGVAEICKLIKNDNLQAKRFTGINNTVAIVTNGTAILGLGNIGPVAGMPVMEGKAVLFEQLVDVSGVPILLNSSSIEDIVQAVKIIAPTFGAIQLEDIAAPECFEIEERLQKDLSIPVLHDDQHATAVVVLAALMTISRRKKISLADCSIGLIGLGAAGLGIARLLFAFGVRRIIGTDLREDALSRLKTMGGEPNKLPELMQGSDIAIATTGCPGLIKPEMVRVSQVILALSNPDPEIDPEVALAQGASFASDGRTINNALAFPGLFKGALKAGATHFTDEMKIAAAKAIAGQTKEDYLVPSILDKEMHQVVVQAVCDAWRN